MASATPPTLGVVLAGGLARRMGGGDKAFLKIGDRTILERTLARLKPQCGDIVINANADAGRFSSFGFPVVADSVPDFAGPLAGILAGLDWAAENRPDTEHIVSVPCDCPFLPADLVDRLHAARVAEGRAFACARSGARLHPTAALWRVGLRDDLRRALSAEGLHKVETWAARHGVAAAEWPDRPIDPFFNINTPEDFAAAAEIAARNPDA